MSIFPFGIIIHDRNGRIGPRAPNRQSSGWDADDDEMQSFELN
jgi:hypothetical protein